MLFCHSPEYSGELGDTRDDPVLIMNYIPSVPIIFCCGRFIIILRLSGGFVILRHCGGKVLVQISNLNRQNALKEDKNAKGRITPHLLFKYVPKVIYYNKFARVFQEISIVSRNYFQHYLGSRKVFLFA